MKRISKITALVLALCLMLLLASCGTDPKDISGNVTPNDDTSKNDYSDDDTQADEQEFSIGSTKGGVYRNEFLGIQCELDENWTYYSDEEIAELNGDFADDLTNEEISEALKDSDLVYDMYVTADNGLVSININIENLGVLYGMTLDEDGYLDIAEPQLEPVLSDTGLVNISIERVTINFAGKEHRGLSIYGDIPLGENLGSIPFYEKLVCLKQGNYMACVTVGSAQADITDTLLGYFEPIE